MMICTLCDTKYLYKVMWGGGGGGGGEGGRDRKKPVRKGLKNSKTTNGSDTLY